MRKGPRIKLKTKMMILFLAIILVPLTCGIVVFFGYGYYENIDVIHELNKNEIMIGAMINRRLMKYLVIAMVVILIITSAIITAWLNRDIYRPLKELSVAMQHISVGDFDYHMNGGREDEIGILYDNYEQMRLQLKESEEEKEQNEKKSKELVSNISHDLKTPITSIKGYVEGIMDGVADTPEKIDKYIKTIYNKANDMDKLINELTTYSGIDSNKIPYHFHILNVSDYFSDCVEEVGLDLESKNIHLNFTNLVSPDTCVVADPEQLKKVINNIISNSVKYMGHDNGVIDIRILDESESVKIEIEDDGKGIASKDIGNIFERFYRTDSSRNSLQGGSGIGLSIVKKIIEDHGGYVWATSKEGEGTCMHFVLRKYMESTDEVVI
ncbi:MAG: HAMP domain-containing sensor histidine kinase [Lachnospiraceae bacterium]|jgi:signal transduction histidine kinase|nr:HAMP domain-containing sensor histidine kinase [Lachnospiraceae bacterium]HBV83194.1 two-component sensor histidine kinase [Lachnospiraceae bacterium]